MNVGEYIKSLRKKHNMTQQELGDKIGVKRAAVQKWECGRVQNLKRATIQKLSEIFDVEPSNFINDNSKTFTPSITEDYVTFPVIGDIAAGYDNIAIEDWDGEVIDIPTSYLKGRKMDEFFILRVKGDSMFPTYHENDKILILKQTTLNYSGQVGAVLYDDDYATLKKIEYKDGENWMRLVPINPLHQIKQIEDEELEHCRILGIPKLMIRDITD